MKKAKKRLPVLYKMTVERGPLYADGGFCYDFRGPNKVSGAPRLCENGFHACRRSDVFMWPGTELWRVRLSGRVLRHDGKLCGERLRFVSRDKRWNERKLRRYARWFDERFCGSFSFMYDGLVRRLCQCLSRNIRTEPSRYRKLARAEFERLLRSK